MKKNSYLLILSLLGCSSGEHSTLHNQTTETENPVIMQYFHWYLKKDDNLWLRLSDEASALAQAGITSLWLPPASKGNWSDIDVGYGVYDLYDLGEFDQKKTIRTKYGTKDEYLNAINAAKQAGMKVYADIVFNHRFGGDAVERVQAQSVDNNDRYQKTSEPIAAEFMSRFQFPGRSGKYSSFEFDSSHFTGTRSNIRGSSEIFLFEGKSWSPFVDWENSNSDYLMGYDLDFQSLEVVNELINWGKWFVDETDIDGFRLDAIKHIDYRFFPNWLKELREYSGKNLFAVGEYLSFNGPGPLEAYLTNTGEDANIQLFDIGLHLNLWRASSSNGNFDLRKILSDTLLAKRPDKAITFVDSHDTQPCQAFGSTHVLNWFKNHAHAFILFQEMGVPLIFFADYFGAEYEEFGCVGIIPKQKNYIDKLLKIRQRFAHGTQHSYYDDPDLIGFTREGKENGLALLLTDRMGGSKAMFIGKQHQGKTYCEIIRKNCTSIDKNGWANFEVTQAAVAVYVEQSELLEL